ncbi:MAG TPA: hypothetical protein VN843_14015 [Anaerolineales bacterium]|nr:hypothetical protein [Anaerolineales bacterium]
MKFWTVLCTEIDTDEDIPYSGWQSWVKRSATDAEIVFAQIKKNYEAGIIRRVVMLCTEFDCGNSLVETETLYSLRHPLQKKVIYNKQKKKEVVKEEELPKYNPGMANWEAIHNLFKAP